MRRLWATTARCAFVICAAMLAVPLDAQAASQCYEVQQNVRYCPQPAALLLGHVAKGEKALNTPLSHTRLSLSNETKPFSATAILSIPVRLPADRSAITPANLYAVFRDMIDANTFPKGQIKDQWMMASDINGATAVVGEFQALSASGFVNANYVFDAWLGESSLMVLLTFDGEETITAQLRDQHIVSRSNLEVRP